MLNNIRKMLELDDVELVILKTKRSAEIAKKAIERKTGARGLRSIIEGIMLDVMFDLPSREDIEKCVITGKTVTGRRTAASHYERRHGRQ